MSERFHRHVATLAIAASLLFIGVLTLAPSDTGPSTERYCLICGQYGGVDVFLNVLLFAPLGFGLALRAVPAWLALLTIMGITVGIESAQLEFIAGRDASLSDVVFNSIGGTLGYVTGCFRGRFVQPTPRLAAGLALAWLATWVAIQVLVAFSFRPVLPAQPYYAQIDRPPGRVRPSFPGSVVSTAVADVVLRRGHVAEGARVAALLRSGAPLTAVVRDGGPVSGKAEIVVVSGNGGTAAASLEQQGQHLIFGIRTGAEFLRLRPYEYRLRRVFQDSVQDTAALTVAGRYVAHDVALRAERRDWQMERRFTPRLSQGWILILPTRTYVDDDMEEHALSALYFVLLLAPAGYWLYRTPRRWTPAGVATVVLTAGIALVAVPAAFGLRSAHPMEWVAALLGVLVGYFGAASAARISSRSIGASVRA